VLNAWQCWHLGEQRGTGTDGEGGDLIVEIDLNPNSLTHLLLRMQWSYYFTTSSPSAGELGYGTPEIDPQWRSCRSQRRCARTINSFVLHGAVGIPPLQRSLRHSAKECNHSWRVQIR
jgi:hypothetical protein